MANDQHPIDSTPLPPPVTGVARGGHGTGTALEDTQLYDVSDFTPVQPAPAAPSATAAARSLPPPVDPAPVEAVPAVVAPAAAAAVAPVGSQAPRSRAPSRTATSRKRRVGAPVAGLAGFALAAGLAILIGAVLGGVPMPDGAAAGGETTRPTTTAEPARTEAPKDDKKDDGDGGGRGNGNGNNGNGNGNGRGNDDDD